MTPQPPPLRDYQQLGVEYLRARPRAGLLMDMGLGKTATVLSALEPRHLPVLVIAPKLVTRYVWPAETALWRKDLKVALAVGTPAQRAKALAEDADVTVISRDNQADALGTRPRGLPKWRTVVFDELSGYKSRGVRWRTGLQLAKGRDHVWGLTGTPAPGHMLDLWPQVALLDNGARLGRNITTYRRRYFTPGRQLPNGTIIEWNLRPGALDEILRAVEDILLAMQTVGRVHLPPVTVNPVRLDLPRRDVAAYEDMHRNLVADLRGVFGDDLDLGKLHTAMNAAVATSKLSQISAGFLYEDPVLEPTGAFDADGLPVYRQVNAGAYTPMNDAKMRALADIVEAQDSPILVFYRYKAELEMLRKKFPQASHIKDDDAISRWCRGEVPMLLAHPGSAAHGLNLQSGGHTIVWTSLTWDQEQWAQANKRLARSGQQHPVVIHTLMATPIDWLILARLEDKAEAEESVMAYLESPL